MNSNIEVIPVEIAGRGSRSSDSLCQTFDEMVDDVYQIIQTMVSEDDYALFGHSMGAYINYELLKRIQKDHLKYPVHVFFSGASTPYGTNGAESFLNLNEQEKIDFLYNLGGISKEVISNPVFCREFLPIIEHDFTLCAKRKPDRLPIKFLVPTSILYGVKDERCNQHIFDWSASFKQCCFYPFSDGHFFVNTQKEQVLNLINQTL